jgi:hypothetical protein
MRGPCLYRDRIQLTLGVHVDYSEVSVDLTVGQVQRPHDVFKRRMCRVQPERQHDLRHDVSLRRQSAGRAQLGEKAWYVKNAPAVLIVEADWPKVLRSLEENRLELRR